MSSGRDGVVGIATRYGQTVLESNPGEGEIFRTRTDCPRGPPSLLQVGTGSFSVEGGKATREWRWPHTLI